MENAGPRYAPHSRHLPTVDSGSQDASDRRLGQSMVEAQQAVADEVEIKRVAIPVREACCGVDVDAVLPVATFDAVAVRDVVFATSGEHIAVRFGGEHPARAGPSCLCRYPA